ncbi:hypothetical protein Aspvir_000207 [Aspergillus viridinutans]|uniref:Uncharacterized protein n=1 Tax=Aspergillus viridinutans TaxID=75553 RepID=A0A9P3BKX4_ASPVI|nr:uncharacterized protein Aspvir_000207 [Aspergillus viridinutans]GIJ98094.1 hypothetical protein Aspvir_000207 [Aspergillus viridinutans]
MQSTNKVNKRDDPYHFFGDLWLESPEEHLSREELSRLMAFEPLICDLENRTQGSAHDIRNAFSNFALRETEAWESLGVERSSKLLVQPSGYVGAVVACHLHNPTFYVKDPYCQETETKSNPTIQQVNQAGFSSQNCFIFDHICRRDRTEDVLLFYNDKILGIHEDFMLSLRRQMGAKVEICWGRHVRERMKKLVNLVPFKLWGRFQDVELYLELEDQRLIRFVIFVAHPQFFFYHGFSTESGVRFRATSAKKQDLYLTVASKLGGIAIREDFYETIHRPALYGQFTREHREIVNRLEAEADSQLKKAFPQKYHQLELAMEICGKKSCDGALTQQSISQLIRGDTIEEELRRSQHIHNMTQSFLEAAGQVLIGSINIRNTTQLQLLSELPSDWDNISEWHEIPDSLVEWIQQQAGLQIDQKPISSKDELLTAFYLLSPANHGQSHESLMRVIVKVGIWYITRAQKKRHESVVDLIIPGARPYDIVRRKCSKCGERVLDDAFASYAKEDPKKYVIWYRLHGCGRPACSSAVDGTYFANLIPLDPNQGYKIATRRSLQRTRSADLEEYLLRLSEDERRATQKEVQTRCRNCGTGEYLDKKPRWTAETSSRYVIPVRGCRVCKKRFCSFDPTDPNIATISKVSLSKKWRELKQAGIDPIDYPRRPEILWSHKSHLTKRKELERERDMLLAKEEAEVLSQEPKKRNFNSKRRLKS